MIWAPSLVDPSPPWRGGEVHGEGGLDEGGGGGLHEQMSRKAEEQKSREVEEQMRRVAEQENSREARAPAQQLKSHRASASDGGTS